MPDAAEAIELLENEVEILIMKAHKTGLKFSKILEIFLEKAMQLAMRTDVEYWLEKGKEGE